MFDARLPRWPSWLCWLVAAALASTCARAAALDVDGSISVGSLVATGLQTSFVYDQLTAEAELGASLILGLSAGLLLLRDTRTFHAANVAQFGAGIGYQPSERFELDLDAHVLPATSLVQTLDDPRDPRVFQTDSSAYGGNLSAVYVLSTGTSFAQRVDLSLGVTLYRAEQRVYMSTDEDESAAVPGRLWQGQAVLTYTATLASSTDVSLSGSYAVYASERVQASGGQLILVGGMPLEPVQYALRPTLARRFGPLELSLHGQYGHYTQGLGFGWGAGVKAQLSFSELVNLSLSAEQTRMLYTDGSRMTVSALALGLAFAL